MSICAEDVALPPSFLYGLQPAGAFLASHGAASSMRSPTSEAVRVPPVLSLAERQARAAHSADKAAAVAQSFMTAMRRGLDELAQGRDSDSSDDEEDDDDEAGGYYYQPCYNEYHAPATPGKPSVLPTVLSPHAVDEDDLIFPLEL